MMHVRALRADDYGAVAELIVRAAGFAGDAERAEQRLRCVCGGHPCRDDDIPSLLAEDETGKVQAFLPVVPRPMRVRGREVRAAVAGPLIVHPECRRFVGTPLLRALLRGPQDLSLMDGGGCATRAVWERLGGSAAVLYNLAWTRPLRPAGWMLGRLRGLRGARLAVKPIARLADAVLSRMPGSPFRLPPPASSRDVDSAALAASMARIARPWLHASHDAASLAWLLDRAAERLGARASAFVVGPLDAPTGCAVMSSSPGGIAHVMSMAAVSGDAADEVVRAMFGRAAAAGCVAVTGRVDSRFLNDLTDRGAMLHASGLQTLVHARDASLVRDFERGDAVLGRLDGAWWMGL